MSTYTETVGYPVHRVVTYSRWENQHGAKFTDWTSACGVSRTASGQLGVFGLAGTARRLELCPDCFPGRTWGGYFPDPVEVPKP
jgi:hypothetical protein